MGLGEVAKFIISVSDEVAALMLVTAGIYMLIRGYDKNMGYILVSWGFVYLTGKSNPKARRSGGLGVIQQGD